MMQAVSPCSTNYYYLPPSTRSTVSYTATISPSRLNCLIRWARTFRDIRHEQSFRQPGSPPQGAYGLGRAGSLGLRTRLPSTGSKASVRWQAGTICKGSDACISRNWNCGVSFRINRLRPVSDFFFRKSAQGLVTSKARDASWGNLVNISTAN